MRKIIILGAGPCGLAAAWQLLKKVPDVHVTVIDRAKVPGGAGASFAWEGHQLDYGPHAFHARGGEAEKLVRSLFSKDPDALIEGRKIVSIYLKGKFFKYPLQINEALVKFNPFLTLRILIEFFLTSVFHALVSVSLDSFKMWGQKRFGPTLYRLGFGDYSEKVWKTPADRISVKFASEKIQGFSFLNLIKKLFKIGGEVTEPYYQNWLYPRTGSGEMYNRMLAEIRSMGAEVFLGAEIRTMNNQGNHLQSLGIYHGGKETEIPGDAFISTIALPQTITLLENIPEYYIR